jgi:hypothetical protein
VLGGHLPNSKLGVGNAIEVEVLFRKVPQLENDHAQKVTYSLTRLYEEFEYPEFLQATKYFQDTYGECYKTS